MAAAAVALQRSLGGNLVRALLVSAGCRVAAAARLRRGGGGDVHGRQLVERLPRRKVPDLPVPVLCEELQRSVALLVERRVRLLVQDAPRKGACNNDPNVGDAIVLQSIELGPEVFLEEGGVIHGLCNVLASQRKALASVAGLVLCKAADVGDELLEERGLALLQMYNEPGDLRRRGVPHRRHLVLEELEHNGDDVHSHRLLVKKARDLPQLLGEEFPEAPVHAAHLDVLEYRDVGLALLR
mmetsp:Transcript_16281/g.63465  ORF Transcript_16281/g.63465 Transcript_16281/m.63465 type:complete len:241 (-) Transcript_16281:1515-2237(-)